MAIFIHVGTDLPQPPIAKSARSAPQARSVPRERDRLKNTRVVAGFARGTVTRSGTIGWANNSAERNAERAAQDVAGLSGRKDDGIERRKYKPEGKEIEGHASNAATLVPALIPCRAEPRES